MSCCFVSCLTPSPHRVPSAFELLHHAREAES
jgi:hypothetical protein